ncbi:hypothetical protein ACHWQZ_G009586 [Mnemiopsis leidyi]
MDVTVDQAIENIWNCKSEEDFLDVTLTLLKLIQNVLFNPDKPKFKKIKRNTAFFFTNPGVEQFLGVCGFEVRENWMIFMDTEVAFLKIDTGKRQLLSYRKKVDSLKAYEVPENSLRYTNIMLGKGKFASVFQGSWENCQVAIKALHPYCSDQAVKDFRREAEILRSLKHNNIVILYAVCLQNVNKRHAHVLELMDRTILDVLRTDPDLTTERLVAKALEVAAGLDHIHSKDILHCDIAARNILLNIQGVVKISDFGLARYADSPDCNLVGKATVFPIRWTAPEVFTENILTKSSDVWSYGILCYEFITRGKTPYGTFQNRQIKRSVASGYRLPKSDECPDDLYMLMLKCWNSEPSKRPSFQVIYQDLINMKLGFAKKQKFAVNFDERHTSADSEQPVRHSTFRRQSLGMRASIRKLVRSVSGKRQSQLSWSSDNCDDSLTVYTTLLQTSKEKVTVHCKKDIRTGDAMKKILQKIGLPEQDSYKYAIVEVFDALSSMRRSQPALNMSPELCTPYVKLKGLLDQPLLGRASWADKENTRYMVCTRGSILRVLELCKQIRDGVLIGQQPYQTRGYLLQSTGLATGRASMMWGKVWGTLDGISLAVFEDEDCEEAWNCSTVLTVQHASVSEHRHDMFVVTDTSNNQHTFQADDRDDAFRWVEAINAAQLSKAPQSSKIAESIALHTAKVLVITGSSSEETVNYGHKQVTLHKEELVFYHNGERHSSSVSDLQDISIVPANPNHVTARGTGGGLSPNGFRLKFGEGVCSHLYPMSHEDYHAWSSALHRATLLVGIPHVIEHSNLNELKEDQVPAAGRIESPDSGILSGDTPNSHQGTSSPELEDSFAELNTSIQVDSACVPRENSQPRGYRPPPLPPRHKT